MSHIASPVLHRFRLRRIGCLDPHRSCAAQSLFGPSSLSPAPHSLPARHCLLAQRRLNYSQFEFLCPFTGTGHLSPSSSAMWHASRSHSSPRTVRLLVANGKHKRAVGHSAWLLSWPCICVHGTCAHSHSPVLTHTITYCRRGAV